jgi:hypothetical protein
LETTTERLNYFTDVWFTGVLREQIGRATKKRKKPTGINEESTSTKLISGNNLEYILLGDVGVSKETER